MELLFGLIAQLLVVALAPLLALVAPIFAAISAGFVALLSLIFGSFFSTWRVARTRVPADIRRRRRRTWSYVLLTPVVVVGAALFVANQFFFAPTLRWAVDLAASRTDYTVELGAVEGDLWSGQLLLGDLRVSGRTADGTIADVTVGQLEADLAVLSLLTSTVRLDRMVVTNADVLVQRALAARGRADATQKERGGRRFVVEMLNVTNAVMVVEQPDGGRHALEIETAMVEPLRSNWAPFDLLFRSNLKASFDGADLRVMTEKIDGDGRRTEWALEKMELTTLGAFTNAAPIRWFDDGTISALMQDEWRRDDITLDTGWQIALRDAEIDPSRVGGLTEALFATTLADVLDTNRGDVDLAIRLVLDENGFRDTASGDLTAWWNALIKGIALVLASGEPVTADQAEGRLRGFTDGVRNILGIERDDP